ncbi:MAG: Tex family protein [Candidatus Endonucleobacter bathymodioli]|uniref:Tex family protein n=1 Tax=Candidatus Endonucleibacter bathymodioli TaxID=539814 RepID=A0AA90NUN8_9GAMM|nr:Tex family protein [Candidatus Endonucleobacter bathymodioli]
MNIISQRIAEELGVNESQVICAVNLLDDGSTVPFIARYRKEATEGLDDTQLRTLEERLRYLRELEERRQVIIKSITDQEKMTPELERDIQVADTKTRLEDLYLPYKPKRRTKAQIAREAGLEPLADELFDNPTLSPEEEAVGYINEDLGVVDVKAALEGARYILMERFSENAEVLGKLREFLWEEGLLKSVAIEGKEEEGAKFRDYFEYDESIKLVPSHRALAIFRGRNEGFLQASIHLKGEPEDRSEAHPCELMVADFWGISDQGRAADAWLKEAVRWTWRVKLLSQMEAELMTRLRERSESEAITVFAKNLGDLLLAAPAGLRPTIGLDPGLRTGVKVAVVDGTGKLVEHATIFPHAPRKKWKEALGMLATLCLTHKVELVSIGNGTGSRETDRLVAELMKSYPKLGLTRIVVSEAGASVYSASELAAREFPDLDVVFRGAVSIARRLQDPLAELVKIEPKAIGVGQYQHDVSQTQLSRSLEAVVEDCVNAVGVDVNSASGVLLSRVSGLSRTIADNIVSLRDKSGVFKTREDLKKVDRFGPKAFEQAAGFLRVMGGDNPLDSSAVHPEAYPLVEQIAARYDRDVRGLIGDSAFLKALVPSDYTNDKFGVPTVIDIISELDKPGRDPRPGFKAAEFKEGVEDIRDLKLNMELEGSVTNVTNFGAFVDIGVHQDGLVHISALSESFVKDPREVVKAGDIVKVKVMGVDVSRKRIGLTMRMADSADESVQRGTKNKDGGAQTKVSSNNNRSKKSAREKTEITVGTFAELFAGAKKMRK